MKNILYVVEDKKGNKKFLDRKAYLKLKEKHPEIKYSFWVRKGENKK